MSWDNLSEFQEQDYTSYTPLLCLYMTRVHDKLFVLSFLPHTASLFQFIRLSFVHGGLSGLGVAATPLWVLPKTAPSIHACTICCYRLEMELNLNENVVAASEFPSNEPDFPVIFIKVLEQ